MKYCEYGNGNVSLWVNYAECPVLMSLCWVSWRHFAGICNLGWNSPSFLRRNSKTKFS